MTYSINTMAATGGSSTINTSAIDDIIIWAPTPTTGTGLNWGTTSGSGTYTIAADPNLKGTTLHVKGNAEFEGDVTFEGDIAIKGKSIKESLLAIEERLAILRPNEELEEKWENLRGLRKMYMELEQEIIEKEKMWAILKK